MRRRNFLIAAVGAVLAACGAPSNSPTERSPVDRGGRRWRMPDEGDRHERTWMALAAREDVWGKKLLPDVQRSLMLVATTIGRFEPVSMLVRPDQVDRARALLGAAPGVTLVPADLDDLWIRDTGPTFVTGDKGLAGVDFTFNGWGTSRPTRPTRRSPGSSPGRRGPRRCGPTWCSRAAHWRSTGRAPRSSRRAAS